MQMHSQKRENVQTTIVALLLARKGGCTLSQLSKDYYETEGEHIPWKGLGYLSLLNFLQSMSRSVHIEYRNNAFFVRGIASEKSKHVSKLVAGQKDQRHPVGRKSFKPSHYYPSTIPQKAHIPAEILTMIIGYVNENPDGVNKDYLLQKLQSHMPYARISMSDMEEQLHGVSHQIQQSHNKVFPVHSKPRNNNIKSAIITASGEDDSDDMLDYDDDDDFGFAPAHASKTKSAVKTKSTSSFIRETVSKCQDQGIENNVLDTHTSRVQDDQTTSFDLHNYNYNDNDQAQIEFKNNVERENYFDGENVDILINERVKFRLEKLIQCHPNGIWCADLPEKYLQEYKVSLNYAELGFNSVREFASQLSEIFHCVQPGDTGDFMLYYAKNGIPSTKQKEEQNIVNLTELHQIYDKDDESEALPTTLSLDTCKRLIPDGIITIGECVGQINVGDLLNGEKPYVEVVVVEVFTPSFFWIQLRKKQKAFKIFMDNLHDFYSRKYEQYSIPPVVLEKGLNCACIYNGIWHRGIIKTVKPDLQVTVMFYDYGTLKTYPPEAVFYLHRMFSSIPAQAIPCGLFNTKPYKGSKWSRSATHHFAVRTSQVPLVATIASINTEDNSMMITLTDTTEEEDIHINDWLVEQRLAQHGKMGNQVDMSNLLLYVEENLIYSPEQCYEDETKESETSNKSLEEKSINVPLISPQSTLDDKAFKYPPELPPSDEPPKLPTITEQCLENQTLKNDSPSSTFPLPTINTNPFLQDEAKHNQVLDELTPEKFMQLWNENLKLQMQITATFHLLFNRVIKNSEKNVNGNSAKDENIIKMMSNMFSHTNNNMPMFENFEARNIPSTTNTGVNNFMNVQYPIGTPAFPTANDQQPLHFPADNRNLNCNNYTDAFQRIGVQNPIRTMDNNVGATNQFLGSKGTATNESYSGFEQLNTKFNTDLSIPMSPDNSVNNKTPLKETNPFRLSLAGKLEISDLNEEKDCLNLNLASTPWNNREQVTENTPMNFQKDTGHGIAKSVSDEFTFQYNQHAFPNGLGNININDNSPIINTNSHPPNHTWGMDNITNNMSNVIINNSSVPPHGIQQTKGEKQRIEKSNEKILNFQSSNFEPVIHPPFTRSGPQNHVEKTKRGENFVFNPCFSLPDTYFFDHNKRPIAKASEQTKIHANGIPNFNQAQFTQSNNFPMSEGTFNCRNSNENCISSPSWLPINSSLSFGLTDNTNIDEGYLTRPSTSHTSYRSSPLVQMNSEIECSQQSLARNSNELCNKPTKMWIKSIEEINTIQLENWNKMYSLSKRNENVGGLYDNSQQQKKMENTAMKDTGRSYINVNDVDDYSLCLAESESQNILKSSMLKNAGYMEKNSSVPNYPMRDKVFFLPIELPKSLVHVFHYQREGWLLIDEFVKTFTEFEGALYMMDFLYLLNIHIPVQEIDKTQYTVEALQLDGTLLETTHFVMYNPPTILRLMPLNVVLKLLNKLKIISRKDIEDAMKNEFVQGSVIHAAWLVINAYGHFKHHIESSQQA